MISIQDLGTQIYNKTPLKFYAFGGQEYGVKDRYISMLANLYGEMKECDGVKGIIDMMSVKHLFPLKPALYVVRYDLEFISSLTDAVAKKVQAANIVGTVVCIYEDASHINKLNKYFPDATCEITSVNPKFVFKYLKEEFPSLDDRLINIAINLTGSYGHARTVCHSMGFANQSNLLSLNDVEIGKIFGCSKSAVEDQFRSGVAGRDFRYLSKLLDEYEGDLNLLIYTIMQTIIDIEKVHGKKYSDSVLHQYCKLWTVQDLYYMFMQCYNQLKISRSSSSFQPECSLMYLFSLLTFKSIPSIEALS